MWYWHLIINRGMELKPLILVSETHQALKIALWKQTHLNLAFKKKTTKGITLYIKCDRVKKQSKATFTCT